MEYQKPEMTIIMFDAEDTIVTAGLSDSEAGGDEGFPFNQLSDQF